VARLILVLAGIGALLVASDATGWQMLQGRLGDQWAARRIESLEHDLAEAKKSSPTTPDRSASMFAIETAVRLTQPDRERIPVTFTAVD
jgi:hypothetical protein